MTRRALPSPPRQFVLLGLKGVNLGLATVMSFALVWVLIRRLPLGAYSSFVLISALGAYVMATDLGFSSVVYHRLRRAFLEGDAGREKALAFTAVGLYLGVVLVAELLVGGWLLAGGTGQGPRYAFAIYFLAIALSLPWGILRSVSGALDHFVRFETIEAARRTVLMAGVFAMGAGLPLWVYALIALALWPLAYAALLPALLKDLAPGRWEGLWRPREALRENGRMMGGASVFSLTEFAIYNFPYVALPLLFGPGSVLIGFDVFFKVTRFGAQSYLVASESLLPANTRAIHAADGKKLLRNLTLTLLLSAVACIAGALAVTLFGDTVFHLLLKNGALVPVPLRWCMAAMLLAMMFQAASGTLLLNTGKMAVLSRVSVCMALAMAALTGVCLAMKWSFLGFMQGYVAVFSVGAVVYFTLLVRSVRRLMRPSGFW